MRASIKNYMDALRKQREERGEDGGFSLIELIIVVVILGILAAIAIPIFLNIQQDARDNAVAAATANAATQVTAAMAQDPAVVPSAVDLTNITEDFNPPLTFTVAGTAGDIDSVCVTSVGGGGAVATSGPDC
jgi:type IV pilus assembly protein PilA